MVLLLTGCQAKETPIQEKFDTIIPSLCVENIGPDITPYLEQLDAVFTEIGVPQPYSVLGDDFGGESQVVRFDTMDSNKNRVHVIVTNSTDSCVVTYTYDTPEEVKQQIIEVLQKMYGESVDVQIEDTYYDYVIVHARGEEYRWKDGRLERVSG